MKDFLELMIFRCIYNPCGLAPQVKKLAEGFRPGDALVEGGEGFVVEGAGLFGWSRL